MKKNVPVPRQLGQASIDHSLHSDFLYAGQVLSLMFAMGGCFKQNAPQGLIHYSISAPLYKM